MREARTNVKLIVATAPTPNGPLHLGHLGGPYVVADVAARAARARGERVLTMSGLDPNQNYVLAKARLEERPAAEVLRQYSGTVRDAFARARIEYDIFVDPESDSAYRQATADLLTELVNAKAVVVEDTEFARCDGCGRTMHHAYVAGACGLCGEGSGGGTCEGCGGFTTARNLVEPRCTQCGGLPRAERVQLPVLRLEDYRDQLVEFWSRTEISQRVRRLVSHYLDAGLPDVPLAYPTDWGIELADRPMQGLRLDVWAEMGLGFVYMTARALDPPVRTAAEYARAWRGLDEIWCFHGIDNAFYFSIMFPALFAGAGLPAGKVRGMVVNEFYRLDGLKFSTSRNHAIWAHEFLAEEDPGLVRLYLCWDRPEGYESDFSHQAFRTFRDQIQSMLPGDGGTGGPSGLAQSEIARAEQALDLACFNPALAARCVLAALTSDPAGAHPLLGLLTGHGTTERTSA